MRRITRNASRLRVVPGRTAVTLAVAAALLLSGCGSSESEQAAGGKPKAATNAAVTARPDMVAAVSSTKTPSIVELRFNIPERPTIGQPAQIQFSLTPSVDLERLVARFQVPEGLELVSGAETARMDHPTPGAEITHTLTVIPKTDGIFNITAVVLTDTSTESVARTFSIPLIAGSGLSEAPPPSNAPPTSRSN